MRKTYQIMLLSLCAGSISFQSCNKLIDIPASKSQTETHVVFADSSSAVSALLGAYQTLGTSVYGTLKYMGLYSDEYNFTASGPEQEFNKSAVLAGNVINTCWGDLYLTIYQANAVIEESSKSAKLSKNAKQLLIAEAKFLRAYAYFYLVNLYDRVPLLLSTDVNLNRIAAQADAGEVYVQILQDLKDAKADLSSNYQGSGKVRANKWAAAALLSRVYLYLKDWTSSEKEASLIINSAAYSPLPSLEDVFQAGSKETILQFWTQNGFVPDAAALVPGSGDEIPQYTISDDLYRSFDPNDGRLINWTGTNRVVVSGNTEPFHFALKYANRTATTARPEYVMAIRLSELYLIRAEAFAQLEQMNSAADDLNVIRKRAGGIPMVNQGLSKDDCLNAIARERQLELFGEWGHRFLDLKRTGKLDDAMRTLKPTWKTTAGSLPIPQSEITYNSNLKQNNGY